MSRPHSRVAVVTGASRGIGRAIAQRLAADGAQVYALGRDGAALAETSAASDRIDPQVCDVTNAAQVEEVFAALPPVDVLVNNAGASTSNRLGRISLEEWEKMMNVNATGVFLCSRAALGAMVERNWGRIVTIASTASHRGAPYVAAYTASKHAVLGLMRSIAMEVAGSGVTANCVCPTFVRTDMTARTIANIVDKTGMTAAEAENRLTAEIPLGRLVEPDEVAHAVAFLISDGAAAINGQSIVIDGGGIQT